MDSDHWISRLMAAKRQYALQRAQRQYATPVSHHGTLSFLVFDLASLELTVPGLRCTVAWLLRWISIRARRWELLSGPVNFLWSARVSLDLDYLDRLGYDDIEPEDEVRSDYPCPYCYEDHDITSLCSHLEDEHPFESKVVACPVCSARISKDLMDHISLQHGYLFKLQRHHRLRRVAGTGNHTLSYAGRELQDSYLKVLGNIGLSGSTNTSTSVTDSLLSSLVLNLSSSEAEDTSKSSAAVAENNWFKRALPSKTWKTSAADLNLSHEERERRKKRAAVQSTFVQHLLVTTLFDD